jgi:hypothetical protein
MTLTRWHDFRIITDYEETHQASLIPPNRKPNLLL